MRLAAIAAIVTVVAAMPALADGKQPYAHASVIRLTSAGFTLAGQVLSGWSAEDGQILPPMALRSACRVRGDFYRDRDWNQTLAAALDFGNAARSAEHRVLFKVGGHVAVSNQYMGSSREIENVYIDLADLEAGSLAVWSFEGDATAEGRQCHMEFAGFIHSAVIRLQTSADHPGTPPR